MLQIEVMSYGLYSPFIGAPGTFTYDLRVRMYKPDGDRIYMTSYSCEIGAGSPDIPSAVLGLVNNVQEVEKMTDQESRCGRDRSDEEICYQLRGKFGKSRDVDHMVLGHQVGQVG